MIRAVARGLLRSSGQERLESVAIDRRLPAGHDADEGVKLRGGFVEAGARVEIQAAENAADGVGVGVAGIGDDEVAVAGDALEAASGGEVGVESGGAAVVDEALGVGERFPEGDVVAHVLRDGPHAGEVGLFEGADDLGAGFFEGHDAEGAGEAVVLAVVPFAPAIFARMHAQ